MDQRLRERLQRIDSHIETLKVLEELFLQLSAHEKVLYSSLYLTKEGSVEQRKAEVYASEQWQEFSKGLVVAEASYLEGKRKYELKLKAFDAEYLTMKTEAPAIRRQQ